MRPALLTNFEVHNSLLLTVGMCCRAGLWNSSCVRASLAAQQKRIPPANAGDARDAGSVPGCARSPGEGNGTKQQQPLCN